MSGASVSLTLDQYLAGELQSSIRHEYAGGYVFAMSGASARHNRIAGNVFARLHAATRGSECAVFISDVKVRIDDVVYYPDVMVCCDPADDDPYLKRSPCMVVEVLSASTEAIDRREKLYNYRRLPSLQAYLLVAQDHRRIEVYRRGEEISWTYEVHAAEEAAIELPCPRASLSLAQVYERIPF